ncbi:MAG: hypothetical protein ACTHOE_09120 [Conexibacter sp.]
MKRIRTLSRLGWSLALAVVLSAAAAGAAAAAPALSVATLHPDHVAPGRFLQLWVTVMNTGTDPLSGNLTVRYTFPPGVSPADPSPDGPLGNVQCQTTGQVTECTGDVSGVGPDQQVRLVTVTSVDSNASGSVDGAIEVSGGGTSDSFTDPFTLIVGPIGPFAINAFDVGMSDGPVVPATRAGSDPAAVTTDVRLLSEQRELLDFPAPLPFLMAIAPTESFRDTIVHVPAGFVGNPTATPIRCAPSQLTTPFALSDTPRCPLESQIGLVQLNATDIAPLWNVEPPAGTPAMFGFYYNNIVVLLKAKVRPSDNGIDIVTETAPNAIPIPKFTVTLWGNPTDASHDRLRGICMGSSGNNPSRGDCTLRARSEVPFLRTPTSCPGRPLEWGIDMDTYEHPDVFVHNRTETPPMEGCQYNPFDPGFAFMPSTSAPHAPSSVDATVTLSQDWGINGIAPADLRTAVVTLPEGLTINPSSADGLQACTDAQLGIGQEGVATCPDASKLGTVTLQTPLLDHQVSGSIFLRTQNSDDPMSGQLFRIAVEVRSDADGIDIKLPGSIMANPATGQLTTVFDGLPQLPFNAMTLHFKQGPRAPLASPSLCGTHTTSVDLLSWSDAPRHIETSFTTTGCRAPSFAPAFRAGVENPVAGSSSPFHVSLARSDDDAEFRGVTVDTPKGLLARVKDAEQCSNAAAGTGNCPAGSLIGHAKVAAGVGSDPFWVTNGRVYLTGPYRGAPYGLAVVVDAVAGPFNLGTVIVRAAIHVDPLTAQLSVVSDPFPTIVKGVPLHIRAVRISVDKARFMVAPTNCSTQQVGGTATALDGETASLSSRFKVGSCKNLRFAPKLSLFVGAAGHNGVRSSTPFRTVLTQKPGQSNLRSVKVVLPQTLSALLNVVNRACTLTEYKNDDCDKAKAGSAVAKTPLLKNPLKGGVFFVRHPGRPLPDLMVALRGEIAIDLVGRVTIPGGKQLATNFDTIPDAPVTKFTLNLVAGSHGPLGVRTNLCSKRGKRARALIQMQGQNGDAITTHPRLHIRGCGK